MTATAERVAVKEQPLRGGGPARRAMVRWAWRLFRRQWRQEVLILALVAAAVAATVVGSAVAVDSPPPAGAGFGTALDKAVLSGPRAQVAAEVATLARRYGRTDVIESQTLSVPGSTQTFDLRAQDPHGPFGRPMVTLVAGRYPTSSDQVALTPGVAAALHLSVGGTWDQAGRSRQVVGIVENPQSLLDEFALVIPGQVRAPTQVTVLFDAPGVPVPILGPHVQVRGAGSSGNVANPDTIVLALATLGMLLVALVGAGGFTVLAQRRLRAIGMVGALGATDRDIRRVIRFGGAVVGLVGAAVGLAVGLLLWVAYRPQLEASSHHLIGVLALPWGLAAAAMALAVVATVLAANRPARTVNRIPIVVALSGRPAPPAPARRSVVPGLVAAGVAAVLLALSGHASGGGGMPEALVGLVALVVAVALLAPALVAALSRPARRAPVAARLALRGLSRYRSRSGPALAAISVAVLIAVLISVLAAARYSNVLDYAGPNLSANQMVVHVRDNQVGALGVRIGPQSSSPSLSASALTTPASTPPGAQNAVPGTTQEAAARQIAAAVGSAGPVTLESTGATLQHEAAGRNWSGPIDVATPQLLAAFGISPSQVDPAADVLTMRPGLSQISKMDLIHVTPVIQGFAATGVPPVPARATAHFTCAPGSCLAHPVIQELGALPAGTSAPNTLITTRAIAALGLTPRVSGWLVVSPHPLTAAQIDQAQRIAAATGLSVETRSAAPSSSQVIGWATALGIALALAILAMTVGLVRAEAARETRTLAAIGASGRTRRALAATTAGTLALGGALLGTAAGYLAAGAWLVANRLNGGIGALGDVPAATLVLILAGMPALAAGVGWLLAGRQPPAMAQRPLE